MQFQDIDIAVTPNDGYELVPNSIKLNNTILSDDVTKFSMLAEDIVATAEFRVEGSANQPPEISANPNSAVVAVGENAVFTVEADAYPTPTYQWQVKASGQNSFADIAGATAPTLTVASVSASEHENLYRCAVANRLGTVVTEATTLFVKTAPVNLAFKKAATASSTFDNDTLELPPANAFDGKKELGNRWASKKR